MKSILMVLIFSLSSVANAKDISVKVSDMVCAMCAQGIQKKFKKLPEVKKINVDLDSKVVTIQTKKEKDVTDEVIKKLITEAGYNVTSIERK